MAEAAGANGHLVVTPLWLDVCEPGGVREYSEVTLHTKYSLARERAGDVSTSQLSLSPRSSSSARALPRPQPPTMASIVPSLRAYPTRLARPAARAFASTSRAPAEPSAEASPTPSSSSSTEPTATDATAADTGALDAAAAAAQPPSTGTTKKGYRAWLAGEGQRFRKAIPGRTNWIADTVRRPLSLCVVCVLVRLASCAGERPARRDLSLSIGSSLAVLARAGAPVVCPGPTPSEHPPSHRAPH